MKDAAAFPDAPLSSQCQHSPGTCAECVSRVIDTHVSTKSSPDVPCPECPGILSYEAVQKYAGAETRGRYDELCVRRALQEDKDFVWVSASPISGIV